MTLTTTTTKSANVKLVGFYDTHHLRSGGSTIHAYIGNSMRGLIKPVKYSLSYADYDKQNPKSVKTLCHTLNNTGSYWSNSSFCEPMSQTQIKDALTKASSKDIETLIAQPDSYISVTIRSVNDNFTESAAQ